MTVTGLPPAVQLKRSYKVNHDGHQDSGPLVADEKGIGVDVTTKGARTSFLKVQVLRKRYYLLAWQNAVGYDIARPAPHMVGGSTTNSHDLVFTVRTTTNQHSFLLHATEEQWLRNQLGRHLAQIDNRA